EAFALLRVAGTRKVILGTPAGTNEGDYQNYKRNQQQLVKSHVVLAAVLRKPGAMQIATMQEHKDEALDWLENQLVVDYPGDAEILRIAMKGALPSDLAKIVNLVKDCYKEEIADAERSRELKQFDTLENALVETKEEMRKTQLELHAMEQ